MDKSSELNNMHFLDINQFQSGFKFLITFLQFAHLTQSFILVLSEASWKNYF